MEMLNEILGIKWPLIQGGMARIATGIFAAAISNIGALGVIGSGAMSLDELREQIQICKRLTNHPFAVNLIMNHREIDSFASLMILEKVPIVITGNGNPIKYIDSWKGAEIKVLPVIGTPAFAKFMERQGADAIIAEGCESGGHIGPMTTMTLVPQVCDSTTLPVVAAGGIADHRQFRAALALGACGVQVGTALLVSEECPVHERYKEAVIKAKSNANVVTGYTTGDPVRCIRNNMVKECVTLEKNHASREQLDRLTMGGLYKAAIEGDVENGSIMAGLTCGQISRIQSAENIIRSICCGDEVPYGFFRSN